MKKLFYVENVNGSQFAVHLAHNEQEEAILTLRAMNDDVARYAVIDLEAITLIENNLVAH